MSKLYFTRSGADRIMRQKQELYDRLLATQRQKGGAAETGGNQWHDNFSFEQLERDERRLNAQIAELNEKINSMVVVDRTSGDTSRLRLGHIAVLDVGGGVKTFLVGGFEDSDPDADPPIISYLAPLINPFIGEELHYTTDIDLNGRSVKVELTGISLPGQGE